MIRVTAELVPHGDESRKETLGTIEIWNDGSGTPWLASYGFRRLSSDGRVLKEGFCGEFKRADYNVWYLLSGVLEGLFPKRSKAWRDNQMRFRLKASGDE